MKTKTIMLCTVALTIGACSTDYGSGSRYVPRPEVAQGNSTETTRTQDDMDLVKYDRYEHRETCQRYRELPRNHDNGCVKEEPEKLIVTGVVQQQVPASAPVEPLDPIVRSYTVLFDFDKSDIRANENSTLDQAMNEIAKYQPTQVTVTGYTDSSGSDDYNQTLSSEREQAVSSALLKRGIESRMLDRHARGEHDQAVKTEDGVVNQENRRVVVDFRRQM